MNQLVQLNNTFADRSLRGKWLSGARGKGLKWTAEVQFALQLVSNNDKLQECTPESFQIAMLDVAFSGLSLAPSKGHAYLIPYGNTVTFSPGYRGLVHIAFKAGTLKDIQPNLVYERDNFRRWTDETGDHLLHEHYAGTKPGPVTHAYCIAQFMNGGRHIEVMTITQLNACKKQAQRKAGGGKVWNYWEDQMQLKTVIRRASKYWPMDDGGMIQRIQEVMDKHDPLDFDTLSDAEPPEQEMCISLDQVTVLRDILTDGGLDGAVAANWLKRYAKAKCGAGSIEGLPERLYEAAKTELAERLTKWKETHG